MEDWLDPPGVKTVSIPRPPGVATNPAKRAPQQSVAASAIGHKGAQAKAPSIDVGAIKQTEQNKKHSDVDASLQDKILQKAQASATLAVKGKYLMKTSDQRSKKQPFACPYPECPTKVWSESLKNHALNRHLPLCFKMGSIRRWEEMRPVRANALQFLVKELEVENLEGLFQYLKEWWTNETPRALLEITGGMEAEMRYLCQQDNWPVPQSFQLMPPNSPAVIIHWRMLLFLVTHLPPARRIVFQCIFSPPGDISRAVIVDSNSGNGPRVSDTVTTSAQISDPTAQVSIVPNPVLGSNRYGPQPTTAAFLGQAVPQTHMEIVGSPSVVPLMAAPFVSRTLGPESQKAFAPLLGFDSHFHQDQMESSMQRGSSDKANIGFEVSGGVRNYSDPNTFNAMPLMLIHPWHQAIGIHPKNAKLYTASQWIQFEKALSSRKVSGISDVGLDHSCPEETWDAQQDLLDRILWLGTLGYVLILHVKGHSSDPQGQEVHRQVFKKVKMLCSQLQRVHLHNFSGSLDTMTRWFEHFPNSYASFSSLVQTFDAAQLEALRACPLERMLLETDVMPEVGVNIPNHLRDVAQEVAHLCDESVGRILEATRRNGLKLYFGLPEFCSATPLHFQTRGSRNHQMVNRTEPNMASTLLPFGRHVMQRCPCVRLCRLHRRLHSRLVLGIESTCDDTGAAVMDEQGNVLGERLHTQKRIHAKNGGIIPMLAQDLHKQFIDPVVQGAISDAGIHIEDLSAVALSTMPGMPLSLRVGLEYTQDLLLRHPHLPLIPIHHMEAHALTVRMVHRVDFPFLVLLVSGGNCILAVARGVGDFLVLGKTWDDAPGEAFDKVARRLNLQHHPECMGLSGGQAIEKIAVNGDIRLLMERSVPMSRHRDCNFSFSGLKNITRWLIQHHEVKQGVTSIDDQHLSTVSDIAASFQHKVAQHLVTRIARAMTYCQQTGLIPGDNQTLVVSGGVASNRYIRSALDFATSHFKYKLICPPPELCTDNGIMIAWAGVERLRLGTGYAADPQAVRFEPKVPLGRDISDDVLQAHIKIKRIKFW